MITVNVKQLAASIAEAECFKLPEMNGGVTYLYRNLFERMCNGENVRLSSLDLGAFESEDLQAFGAIHTDVFERNYYAANRLTSTLQGLAPTCRAVSYV
jgi:hypothetical protein